MISRKLLVITMIFILGTLTVSPSLNAVNLQKFIINPGGENIEGTADSEAIAVIFNPNEVVVQKAVPWKEHFIRSSKPQDNEFTNGQVFKVKAELDIENEIDVNISLAQLNGLLYDPGTKPPAPKIQFVWADSMKFECVMEKFTFEYTDFKPDGIPIRAKVDVTFKEYSSIEQQLKDKPN